MEKSWTDHGPIVIGGVGGSGTRLVAEICRTAGVYLGEDLNHALDNLSFTLLFRRYEWFIKNQSNTKAIQHALGALEKMILKESSLTPAEHLLVLRAALDTFLHYRKNERVWALERIRAFRKEADLEESYQAWGWKEPNTFLLLPDLAVRYPKLKYIHTIRHGLDMAFSRNQRQMQNLSRLFLPEREPAGDYTPADSLKYWIAANRAAAEQGRRLGPDRYLMVNYDELCLRPEPILNEILNFTQLDVDEPTYQQLLNLPQPPESLGRYLDHSLAGFDKEDLEELAGFGFSYTAEE